MADVYELMRLAREKARVPFTEDQWQFHKTKDEARLTLEHEFGTIECMHRFARGAFSVGVAEAVKILGGEVQQWGITHMPTEWK
jgi:hypothetical protein